jgi:hypothetical protein
MLSLAAALILLWTVVTPIAIVAARLRRAREGAAARVSPPPGRPARSGDCAGARQRSAAVAAVAARRC